MERKKIRVFTSGSFDLFHIGHLNLIKNAKRRCDYLIVGVNTDELVESYKNKRPIVPLEERAEIVRSIKYVDEVIIKSGIRSVSMKFISEMTGREMSAGSAPGKRWKPWEPGWFIFPTPKILLLQCFVRN